MKKLFLLIIVSYAFSSSLYSKSRFQTGDTVYVFAVNGMNLRKDASLVAPVKAKIPYGERLLITGIPDNQDSVVVKEFEGFNIAGHFVEVEYRGQSGYIFDGYLSKLIPPVAGESVSDYLTRYGPAGEHYDLIRGGENCGLDTTCVCGYTLDYGKLATVTEDGCGVVGRNRYYFKTANLTEGFLLARVLFFAKDQTYSYSEEQNIIDIMSGDNQGPPCRYEITEDDKGIVISSFCGC